MSTIQWGNWKESFHDFENFTSFSLDIPDSSKEKGLVELKDWLNLTLTNINLSKEWGYIWRSWK